MTRDCFRWAALAATLGAFLTLARDSHAQVCTDHYVVGPVDSSVCPFLDGDMEDYADVEQPMSGITAAKQAGPTGELSGRCVVAVIADPTEESGDECGESAADRVIAVDTPVVAAGQSSSSAAEEACYNDPACHHYEDYFGHHDFRGDVAPDATCADNTGEPFGEHVAAANDTLEGGAAATFEHDPVTRDVQNTACDPQYNAHQDKNPGDAAGCEVAAERADASGLHEPPLDAPDNDRPYDSCGYGYDDACANHDMYDRMAEYENSAPLEQPEAKEDAGLSESQQVISDDYQGYDDYSSCEYRGQQPYGQQADTGDCGPSVPADSADAKALRQDSPATEAPAAEYQVYEYDYYQPYDIGLPDDGCVEAKGDWALRPGATELGAHDPYEFYDHDNRLGQPEAQDEASVADAPSSDEPASDSGALPEECDPYGCGDEYGHGHGYGFQDPAHESDSANATSEQDASGSVTSREDDVPAAAEVELESTDAEPLSDFAPLYDGGYPYGYDHPYEAYDAAEVESDISQPGTTQPDVELQPSVDEGPQWSEPEAGVDMVEVLRGQFGFLRASFDGWTAKVDLRQLLGELNRGVMMTLQESQDSAWELSDANVFLFEFPVEDTPDLEPSVGREEVPWVTDSEPNGAEPISLVPPGVRERVWQWVNAAWARAQAAWQTLSPELEQIAARAVAKASLGGDSPATQR